MSSGRSVQFVVGIRVVAAAPLLDRVEDRALDHHAILFKALLGNGELAYLVQAEANHEQAGTAVMADDRGIGRHQDRRRV